MRWCWPLRCKLRSLSPKRRKDGGESWEVYSLVGSRPDLAPGCSANSFSVRPPPPPPLPPQPPGCQSAWLVWAKQAQAIGPRGQRGCCQLGQHFTAEHHSPNKQCSGPQATGNMEPVITSRARLVHSPKSNPGQGLERLRHLTQMSQSGYVMRESLFRTSLYHQHIDVHATMNSVLITSTLTFNISWGIMTKKKWLTQEWKVENGKFVPALQPLWINCKPSNYTTSRKRPCLLESKTDSLRIGPLGFLTS